VPCAARPASAQRTVGPFHASPCRSLLPRPALAPRSVAVGPSVAGKHAGRHKGVAAPLHRARPRPRSPPVPAIGARRGELQAPAGCTPSRARLHRPWRLP
jgi:hypothetical protein